MDVNEFIQTNGKPYDPATDDYDVPPFQKSFDDASKASRFTTCTSTGRSKTPMLYANSSNTSKDPAFLDRLHGFLPGWEMPKIQPENYAPGYGFITDYLAEIFARLRRKNCQTLVSAHTNFGSMTGRNQDAIRKTAAGLLKRIFPHRTAESIEPSELEVCMSLAIESHQRVVSQLAVIAPTEFRAVILVVSPFE